MRFPLRICRTGLSVFPPVVFLPVLLTGLLLAEGTRIWEQWKFDDLIKGTSQGVAIRSSGGLELAPAFKALSTTPSTFIWSIAVDHAGDVYAAAGSPARVYRITPDGKSAVIFEPQELQVQALVVAKNGPIYAATNPDGKIYKIEHQNAAGEKSKDASEKAKSRVESGWSSSVYFDPGTKYIWSLAMDDAGNLYVATGDQGQVFRVAPNGEHKLFFKSDEAHIRVLALDAKGNLIAGSDGSGLVYRVAPNGDSFVLYSAPKKEITALAIDQEGNIYAAGIGEKRTEAGAAPFPPITIPSSPPPGTPQISSAPAASSSNPALIALPSSATATGGSEIYRIAPDGSPARLWASREDLVYALGFDSHGQLLAGTGNRGHIFAVNGEDQYADLLKASASQVTAFAPAPGGGLYASTSNLGKLFLLSAEPASEGSYESDVFDAHIFSRWGRAEFRGTGKVELFARSGNVDNPDRNWSAWKQINLESDAPVDVPAARFIQWKAVLRAGDPAPRVERVAINYLPKNVAPDFDDVSVQVGIRYQPLPKPVGTDSSGGSQRFDTPPTSTRDRDSIGVKWSVHDDNDDDMVYSVYYRGDGQNRWLLLKDNLTDKFYSFDASLLPDGGYTVKVIASDAPSHSPGQGLSAERESPRFVVDTTPPLIENLTAALDGNQIHISFRAQDSFSPIKRAEYSVDAVDWQFVEPVGQLSDSKTENYDFRVPIPAGSSSEKTNSVAGIEHVVVVRAYDRFDNMSAAKTVIRGK
jgi:hypothetical protein